MRRRRWAGFMTRFVLAGLMAISLAAWAGEGASWQVKVDPTLEVSMTRTGQGGYIIEFGAQADLSPAYSMTWEARGQFVMDSSPRWPKLRKGRSATTWTARGFRTRASGSPT